jgi:hypothetical protein
VIALAAVVAAGASVFIALCSFGLSIYETTSARRHDRLSVQPQLVISFYYDDTGAGWRDANLGLGPAHIRGFKVLVDGVPQKPTDMFELIKTIFKIPNTTKVTFSNLLAGVTVRAGDNLVLVWVSQGADAQRVQNDNQRIKFEICYCSIYKECWLYSTSGPVEGLKDDSCSTFSHDPKSVWWEP